MATTSATGDWARRLNLTEAEAESLERAALEDDRSVAYIIRQALAAYLQARAT
jgi:Ribbon-helix-helix protein, copG family